MCAHDYVTYSANSEKGRPERSPPFLVLAYGYPDGTLADDPRFMCSHMYTVGDDGTPASDARDAPKLNGPNFRGVLYEDAKGEMSADEIRRQWPDERCYHFTSN